LYPIIELLTAGIVSALYIFIPHQYFLGYFIFSSALIVTIRSDIEIMMISRFMTLFLIPVGCMLSTFDLLPITFIESTLGALFGYVSLLSIAQIFYWATGKQGLGQGDIDLMAFIGSFTGIAGCWATLLIGSMSGSFFGIIYILIYKPGLHTRIPFGPFLAFGALSFIFFQQQIMPLILGA
jgi:leader peptidase (prepilin peptidase) / N-methyltransferase